ncbi:MAG: MOSC domain-containing protein, partial [Actinomycetota bacterium]
SHVTERGLLGDRAIALVDAETGKLVSAKRPRLWGGMFGFASALSREPAPGRPLPPARITFPDGSTRSSEDADVSPALSTALGRKIRLTTPGADQLWFEEVWHGGLKGGAEPYGPVVGEEEGEQLIEAPASLAVPGGFFDAAAIHLVTTATLRKLAELAPSSRFAAERFRPNLVIDVPGADGFVENDWPDRVVEIGDVRLEILIRVPRCVMTTLPQGDLPKDHDVLRTITKHNKVAALAGEYPCVGVYANVAAGGEIAVGDDVRLA